MFSGGFYMFFGGFGVYLIDGLKAHNSCNTLPKGF